MILYIKYNTNCIGKSAFETMSKSYKYVKNKIDQQWMTEMTSVANNLGNLDYFDLENGHLNK